MSTSRRKSILDKESNIVHLFDYLVGDIPETARKFINWSMRSVIAGALARRVWVTKVTGGMTYHLAPNLYVLFLAGSAGWKSKSIGMATSLLEETSWQEIINIYPGKITAPGMYDAMQPYKKHPNRNKFYLVQDELASMIGMKDWADQMIKALTAMFYLGRFKDQTRTTSEVNLGPDYSINWLAASTFKWLSNVITFSAVEGGFFPRTITVMERGYLPEPFDPPPPPEAEEVREYIVERLEQMLHFKGEYERTKEAYEWLEQWFNGRELPTTDVGWSYFNRERDMLEKLAMGESAAEGDSMTILPRHYEAMLPLLKSVQEVPIEVTQQFELDPTSRKLEDIKKTLIRSGKASRSELVRAAERHGITSKRLDEYLESWSSAGYIRSEVEATKGRAKRIYYWIGEE